MAAADVSAVGFCVLQLASEQQESRPLLSPSIDDFQTETKSDGASRPVTSNTAGPLQLITPRICSTSPLLSSLLLSPAPSLAPSLPHLLQAYASLSICTLSTDAHKCYVGQLEERERGRERKREGVFVCLSDVFLNLF